ncbi:MAG: NfeD family protein [Traorella sp.]
MEHSLLFWIVACVCFTLLEAFTQQFVSIWFLLGGVVAMIGAYFGMKLEMQCILFVILSLLSLIAFRPIVKKFLQGEIVPTNKDANVGQLAIVTKDFDEVTLEGRILVNDMDWAAKSLDGVVHLKGEKVMVERIEGVKCLVRKD